MGSGSGYSAGQSSSWALEGEVCGAWTRNKGMEKGGGMSAGGELDGEEWVACGARRSSSSGH